MNDIPTFKGYLTKSSVSFSNDGVKRWDRCIDQILNGCMRTSKMGRDGGGGKQWVHGDPKMVEGVTFDIDRYIMHKTSTLFTTSHENKQWKILVGKVLGPHSLPLSLSKIA